MSGTRRWLMALLLGMALPAFAHKSSDAYLQFDATAAGLSVRWDIALRDLDAAIDLDADGDGQLTWAEVRTAWPRIEAYALPRLKVAGCALTAAALPTAASGASQAASVAAASSTAAPLERRNDGTYAVLRLTSSCVTQTPPIISYGLLREVDPTHRGIAKLQWPGAGTVVRMLDPSGASDTLHANDASATPSNLEDRPLTFLREGIHHILTGYDHVLFLLSLLLPSVMWRRGSRTGQRHRPHATPHTGARNGNRATNRAISEWQPVDHLSQAVWPAAGIVTAFTLAHSLTLALAAMKWVSLPPSFIEPAIAVTIIVAALDNVWPIFRGHRAWVTFAFGLIHGFGFAGVLAELNLPAAQFAWALLQFNVGLELGQLSIVAVVVGLLFAARRWRGYPCWIIQGGSAVAIVVAAIWLIERTTNTSIL
jgi:hypothetical protein